MSDHSSLGHTDVNAVPALTVYVGGWTGVAHNEAAFHHLLRIERGRAAKSGYGLALVLVSLPGSSSFTAPLSSVTAARIFAGLSAAVREVDFVGWFRDGRVAGAVLVQRSALPPGTRQQISSRVREMLASQGLRNPATARVRVLFLSRNKP